MKEADVRQSLIDSFYFQRISSAFQGGWLVYEPRYLNRIPICHVDKTRTPGRTAHDRIVKCVDSMLKLHQQLAAANSAAQQTVIQRQIDATDREIDRLVYELYDLTAKEIALVEEAVKH